MKIDLLNKDIQHFIQQNLYADFTKLILKGSPFPNISIQNIVEQIIAKNKCQKKLPTWFKTPQIYYPNKLNIEQTSSEITAKYKAKLVFGNTLVDITGGFGVDCFAFAEGFKKVIHCEINKELSEIVNHNYSQLQVQNIKTYTGNGFDYLKNNSKKIDCIYADPSRRDESKKKVFLLKDCSPNIPKNLDFLFKHTNTILLKLSPILDITSSINELTCIKEIHVIAINNEVKELLYLLEKDYNKPIVIKTINLKNKNTDTFKAILNTKTTANYSLPKKYLYEPNSAILKAGLFNNVAQQLNLCKLHNNSHLYTDNVLIPFPGRSFEIIHLISYDKKKLKQLIPSKKANITTRNFPNTVAEIRKKTGLKDGGNQYLFFTTNANNKHIVLICKKL